MSFAEFSRKNIFPVMKSCFSCKKCYLWFGYWFLPVRQDQALLGQAAPYFSTLFGTITSSKICTSNPLCYFPPHFASLCPYFQFQSLQWHCSKSAVLTQVLKQPNRSKAASLPRRQVGNRKADWIQHWLMVQWVRNSAM